ncbi:LacI family DNA-binding transcriptional regulator [Sphingobium phenoxybenzoativorans]|uniref:LacI family DNA-binding transcriptional regulator n=1 Tax=Sphingobium phenoxybenzoativorans TaxID=1592790 RepID=UPI0008734438|nr:LacI family DNA-binding transcriptional regulator [Sphingobium phenoxybenzoativorans]
MKIVTIKDVAERAGVSAKTVSRVINGEQHVRPEVREAVQRVVAELDYRPNAFARSLSSSRSYLLGLFIDDPVSGYASDVQLGALMRCREKSYHLVVEPVVLSADGWQKQVADSIAALRLDGAIVTPPICDEPELLDLFDAAGLPMVRIAPRMDFARSGIVQMDDHAAAKEMTGHLIGLGHRSIGFVKGDPTHSASAKRFDGFREAMAEAGLAVAERHVLEGDFSFRSGLELGEAMLREEAGSHGGGRPTAIFASNDDMALGVLITAMKLGISVPDGLSVCGFDDAPTSRAAWPQLTTIRQPKAEMAAAAVDILADPRYRTDVTDARYQVSLDYVLVKRGSTGVVGG